ncbi:MAG: Gfo/Idh/MocA family protein [Candidatus Latescibacterota bacterium]|jgi:predicted dehydrogenase
MKTYRVAILGCRSRGTSAARVYHAHPRTEVVGLCDLLEERLNTLGDELGIAARFADLDEMIHQTKPDIVAIPTAPSLHAPLALRALEHGVHIDVEKPMGMDLIETDAIMDKAAKKGVQVAVHHQWRLSPWTQAINQLFQAGTIGELRYIYASGKGYYGGFGLMEIGTHLLTSMIKFGGHCQSVTAHATTRGRPITPHDVLPAPRGNGTIAGDQVTATLQFKNGVTGTLLQHRFDKLDLDAHVVELYGTEGRLLWHPQGAWHLPNPHVLPTNDLDQWQALTPIYPESYEQAAKTIPGHSSHIEGDYCFADEYVRALDEGRAHECSGDEGRHVIEIITGIFESAAYGTRVDLPQANREHPLMRWRNEAGLGEPDPMPMADADWLAEEEKRLGG